MPTTKTTSAPAPAAPAKTAPAQRKFPCKQCGARLVVSPGSSSLKCPYCGYAERIYDDITGVRERELEAYLIAPPRGDTIAGYSQEIQCGGCGAVVILEDNVAADRCPFCATHLENKPRAAGEMVTPESILPFNVDFRKAKDAFEKWIYDRWFAPDGLKKMVSLGQLQGVYLPAWTYNSQTITKYTGRRGTEKSAGMYGEGDDGIGNALSMLGGMNNRRYIEWQDVNGEVHHFFDDMLVGASHSLPYDKVAQLQPWDLENLVAFKPEYLSGFKAERYAVELAQGFEMSKLLIDPMVKQMCTYDIGGDYQILETYQTAHDRPTFKHVLLPAWIASYRYYGKVFHILVNARTGEVVGDRPWSFFKIVSVVTFLLGLAAAILFLTQ